MALAGLLPLAAGAQTAPTVSGVTITSAPFRGDTYGSELGFIDVLVSFSEAVTVTGTPQLALAIGTQTRQADYASGSGTSTLTFSYGVQFSDVDADGVSIAANALTLNGGAIRSAGGVNASLGLGSHAISNASGHKVEGRISLRIVSRPQDGGDTYGVNEIVHVQVWFGQGVSLSPAMPSGCGRVRLALAIGSSTRQVETSAGCGFVRFPRFLFEYEVQSGDVDADGISIAANALTVTGGTLQYAGGTAAHLNFGTHAFANDAKHKVNGGVDTAPMIRFAGFFATAGPLVGDTYAAAELILAFVDFREPVRVTGAPQLALAVGARTRQAVYAGCNRALNRGALDSTGFCSSSLVFGYLVRAEDADADGVAIASLASLALNEGTIRDRSGNDANLGLPARSPLSNQSGHKVDGSVNRAPTATLTYRDSYNRIGVQLDSSVRISSEPQSGSTYGASETIEVDVYFNEPVVVTGSPQLALGIGTQTRQAGYSGCAAGDADPPGACRLLTFAYIVQSADSDADGISIAATALALNGGTIADSGGNNANLGLGTNAVSNASRHKVDGSVDRSPAVSGAAVTSSPAGATKPGRRLR